MYTHTINIKLITSNVFSTLKTLPDYRTKSVLFYQPFSSIIQQHHSRDEIDIWWS